MVKPRYATAVAEMASRSAKSRRTSVAVYVEDGVAKYTSVDTDKFSRIEVSGMSRLVGIYDYKADPIWIKSDILDALKAAL